MLHVRPCAGLRVDAIDVDAVAARRALGGGVTAHIGIERGWFGHCAASGAANSPPHRARRVSGMGRVGVIRTSFDRGLNFSTGS